MAAGTTQVSVEVFGGIRISGQTTTAASITPAERALLGLLIVHRGTPVSADRIEDSLWPEDSPASSAKIIQIYVSHLRRALGAGAIGRVAGGYRLDPAALSLDVVRFEAAVAEGTRILGDDPNGALRPFSEAIAITEAGEPFGDLWSYEFTRNEVERLEQLRWTALEGRFEAAIAVGRDRDVVEELQQAVRDQPLRERLWEHLILALYRAGRQADALEAYQRIRRILADDLGIEPGTRLEELQRAVLRHDLALVGPDSGRPTPTNVPTPPTSMIGRDDELAELLQLLRGGARLITLTGPGGAGKTRLALEIAGLSLSDFPDGVWFIALDSISDPQLVVGTISSGVGVREGDGRTFEELLTDKLRGQQCLLILDNFEHVLDAAPAVARLLAGATPLRILATSRIPLDLRGELEFAVEPLDTPSERTAPSDVAKFPAVRLFVDRASAVARRFRLGPENMKAVASICRRLDGLPLAIELAAVNVRTLDPTELLARLEQRLPTPVRGPRDLPARQQTLRAAIGWSYDLLEPNEQTLFRRLAIFAGGWSAPAAEVVAGSDVGDPADVRPMLERLVSKNLVRSEGSESGHRYRFLETIREDAAGRLDHGEHSATAERHTAFFKGLVEEFHAHWHDAQEAAWLERIEADHDNIRAAMQRAIDASAWALALEMANDVAWFWKVRGHFSEGRTWLERCLAGDDAIDPKARAVALNAIGVLCNDGGRPDEAIGFLEQAIDAGRAGGGDRIVGVALVNLANAHVLLDAPAAAERAFADSLEVFGNIDDLPGRSGALDGLGELARARGDHRTAESRYLESLEIDREIGDDRAAAIALHNLGQLALAQGALDRARGYFLDSFGPMRSAHDSQGMALALDGIAELAFAQADTLRATQLHAAAASIRRAADVPLLQPERDHVASSIEACRGRLSAFEFDKAWRVGQGLDLDSVWQIAETTGLSTAASTE